MCHVYPHLPIEAGSLISRFLSIFNTDKLLIPPDQQETRTLQCVYVCLYVRTYLGCVCVCTSMVTNMSTCECALHVHVCMRV